MVEWNNFSLKNRGQALVEFVMMVPILLIFWIGFVNLSSMYVVKQKLAVASRYGAWLAKEDIPDELVKAEMTEYLSKNKFINPALLSIDSGIEKIRVFYKTTQSGITASYYFYLFPEYFPPYEIKEKFVISGDSWRIKDITGRIKHYGEKIEKGDWKFEISKP
ncbi:MAG: TadE family protein [Candidatus Firestonebacteria bacterium]